MASKSKIEWTEVTWNPVTGCSKVSEGCRNCYAERMAHRLRAMGQQRYANGFRVTLHDDLVDAPRHWRKPRMIFVNSMSDLFHEAVPFDFIDKVVDTIRDCGQHTFQVLTKRSLRMLEWRHSQTEALPENLWMGVSVESTATMNRAHDLLYCDARIQFLSMEPLLEHVQIPEVVLDGIQWVIVGGESGPKSRPMDDGWVRSIRNQCFLADVPFFFKQWGGPRKGKAGRLLDGKTHDEMPTRVGIDS